MNKEYLLFPQALAKLGANDYSPNSSESS